MKLEKNGYGILADAWDTCDMVLIGIGAELGVPFWMLNLEKMSEWEKTLAWVGMLEHPNAGEMLKPYLEVYQIIKRIVQGKDYFLLTTNTDALIYRQGFEQERIVAPRGDFRRMQCEDQTHGVWDISEVLFESKGMHKMNRKDMPLCPVCKKAGRLNIYRNQPYAEVGYQKDWERYMRWFQGTMNKKILIIELGEGFQTPTVMRWPFERAAFLNEHCTFVRVHKSLSQIAEELKEKAYTVAAHSMYFLNEFDVLLQDRCLEKR